MSIDISEIIKNQLSSITESIQKEFDQKLDLYKRLVTLIKQSMRDSIDAFSLMDLSEKNIEILSNEWFFREYWREIEEIEKALGLESMSDVISDFIADAKEQDQILVPPSGTSSVTANPVVVVASQEETSAVSGAKTVDATSVAGAISKPAVKTPRVSKTASRVS